MNLKKSLNNDRIVFVMSFMWGIGLAVILLRKCMDGYCVVVKGPEKKDIEGNVFKVDGECYNFKPEISKCNKNKLPIKSDVLEKKNSLF
jgi:hypothetical protein